MPFPLICPHCAQPLVEHDRTLRCATGHSFDVARGGYVNLLRGSRRGILGDSLEMLHARRAFLEAGHYQPLADRIALWARTWHEGGTTIVDSGCGEGYYTGQVARALEGQEVAIFGVDLSKEAARLASRRYPDVRFVVADVTERLPFANASVDLLLDIFAPRNGEEFARILAPGGRLLVVVPDQDHLAELRETLPLLDIEADKAARVAAALAPHFSLQSSERLSHTLDLEGEPLVALVAMGPSARHLDEAAWAQARAMGSRVVTAAFQLLTFSAR